MTKAETIKDFKQYQDLTVSLILLFHLSTCGTGEMAEELELTCRGPEFDSEHSY